MVALYNLTARREKIFHSVSLNIFDGDTYTEQCSDWRPYLFNVLSTQQEEIFVVDYNNILLCLRCINNI